MQKVKEAAWRELLHLNFFPRKAPTFNFSVRRRISLLPPSCPKPAHHLCLCNCTHSGKANSFRRGRKKKISPVRVCQGHAYLIDINVFVSTKIIDSAAVQIETAPRFPDSLLNYCRADEILGESKVLVREHLKSFLSRGRLLRR